MRRLTRRIPSVSTTVRSRTLAGSGGMREGRVLSRNRSATPARMDRSCQRHIVTLFVPDRRMISLVPRPSAVSSTMDLLASARHAYIESTRYPETAVAYQEASMNDLAKECGLREVTVAPGKGKPSSSYGSR
jgi:hypothetical protein